MADLIVTDLEGRTEILTNYKGLKRKRKVNGEVSISFLLYLTERNKHSFDLAQEESVIELEGQKYRIKKAKRRTAGRAIVREIYARHVMFDLIDNRIYSYLTGVKTIQQALTFALSGSGFSYSVIDSFNSADIGEFGNDNSVSLLNKICDTFGAEVEEDNYVITLKSKIGLDRGVQIRRGYNLKTIEEDVDTSNLSTYIKGYGKENDDGTYVVEAEYTSPNAALFPSNSPDGLRHAEPVRDNRYTQYTSLLERLKKEINDMPDVSIKVTFADMQKAGYLYDSIGKGDVVHVIDEILGVSYAARVLGIDDSPDRNDPDETIIEISNYTKTATDLQADFEQVKKQLKNTIDDNGVIRYNYLPEATKLATESLINASTELEFPKAGGIIGRSKTDPNNLTVFNSNGFGISRDGGQTFQDAITADGFVLSVGAIGQLNANNIDISGTITAINEEGTTTIDGNKITTGTLVVGENVAMGENAYLSWGNITDQPTIEDLGGLSEDSPQLTYIDSSGVYTGLVSTNQLIAGTSKITTAMIENLVVGSNVTMGSNAYLSWNNVINQPFIPTSADQIGGITTGNPRFTHITSTGIYTGDISATTGTFTGSLSGASGTFAGKLISTELEVQSGSLFNQSNIFMYTGSTIGVRFRTSGGGVDSANLKITLSDKGNIFSEKRFNDFEVNAYTSKFTNDVYVSRNLSVGNYLRVYGTVDANGLITNGGSIQSSGGHIQAGSGGLYGGFASITGSMSSGSIYSGYGSFTSLESSGTTRSRGYYPDGMGDSSFVYLVSSNGVRCATSFAGTSYVPIQASNVGTSKIDTKTDIEPFAGNAMGVIKSTPFFGYYLKNEVEELDELGNPTGVRKENHNAVKKTGTMLHLAPVEIAEPQFEMINLYSMASISWIAHQETDVRLVELEQELKQKSELILDLESRLAIIEEAIKNI
jgi:phage minor structural protein